MSFDAYFLDGGDFHVTHVEVELEFKFLSVVDMKSSCENKTIAFGSEP